MKWIVCDSDWGRWQMQTYRTICGANWISIECSMCTHAHTLTHSTFNRKAQTYFTLHALHIYRYEYSFIYASLQTISLLSTFQMPEDDSPISEYHLWRDEEAEYKNILEQIKNPFVICCLGRWLVIELIFCPPHATIPVYICIIELYLHTLHFISFYLFLHSFSFAFCMLFDLRQWQRRWRQHQRCR